jgi:Fe-S-cluster containining protein
MDTPFFAWGLRFTCRRCSKCCRHEPGYVFLSENDIDVFSRGMRVEKDIFVRKYCREVKINGRCRLSLTEKPNFDCVFWEEGGCAAYPWRPLQCRSYPFWHPNLVSRQAWETLRESCPGVGVGDLHSREEIEGWLKRREEELLINRS